jgi:predicted enzyme related to lactoylglutathione lyase
MSTKTSVINGVDFVSVPTKDYEVAAKFYGEVLGLPFGKRWGKMPAGEFEMGIADDRGDAGGRVRPRVPAHNFPIEMHVDDFDAAKAALESRGVELGETIDSGVCWQAHFKDPDGNALAIHHRYAPKEASSG